MTDLRFPLGDVLCCPLISAALDGPDLLAGSMLPCSFSFSISFSAFAVRFAFVTVPVDVTAGVSANTSSSDIASTAWRIPIVVSLEM